jgi:hypothetical protein
VSYLLYDAHGQLVDNPGSLRTPLPLIHAHERLPMTMRVRAPFLPGTYTMRLSMVHEHVAWWAQIGYPGSTVELIVKDNGQDPSAKMVYNIRPTTDIKTLKLAPLQTTTVPVVLENGESFDVKLEALDIHASYRLTDASGQIIDQPGPLRTNFSVLRAHDRQSMEMRIQAPSKPGVYQLHLTMVREHVAWFMDVGYAGSVLTLVVE